MRVGPSRTQNLRSIPRSSYSKESTLLSALSEIPVMHPALFLTLALAQSAAPGTPPKVLSEARCVLEAQGEFKITLGSVPFKPKATRTETFNYHYAGNLNEQQLPDGHIQFVFTADAESKDRPRVSLDLKGQSTDKDGQALAEVFQSHEPWAFGEFVAEAPWRGAPLRAWGHTTLAGQIHINKPHSQDAEQIQPRHQVSVFLPRVADVGGVSTQQGVLRFDGPSLWALKNAGAPFEVQATVQYQNQPALDGATYTGMAKVRLMIEPKVSFAKKP